MLEDIQKLLDRYNAWLRESNNLREIGDWVEITTHYLDRHNDQIQIFARRENGQFVLSDDGYIIRDLESSGCTLATPKRQELLKMALNGFGVKHNHDELLVTATPENFPLRKHNLIQAMVAVNDFFYLDFVFARKEKFMGRRENSNSFQGLKCRDIQCEIHSQLTPKWVSDGHFSVLPGIPPCEQGR
jgi:Domain of unknown function DUF1828